MHHVTDHLHHKSSTDTTSKSTGEKSSMTEKIMHPLHGHKHTEHEHETKKVESSKAYKPEHEHEFKKVEKKKPTERSALSGSESPHKHKLGKESGYDKHKHGTTSGGGHKHSHEHGLSGSQPHVHEHTHPVTSHGGEHLHKHQFGNETHVMHERSPLSPDEYQNLYRSGVDPVANREIECETHDQGGVIREKIGETPVIRELVKPVELHKVQPVIHREREQREIRHVIEPHTEFQVREVHVHHKDRDINLGVRQEGSTLGTSRSVGVPHLESTREFGGVERQHQDLPARVEEHVHKVIEEHVHPVIYKEVLRPKVVEETHHIYETVKEAPIETVVDMSQKGLDRGLVEKLDEAKREFFAHESSRGIPCPLHGTTHEHRHDVSPQHAHVHAHEHVHERSSGSPLKHEHKEKIKKDPKEMLKKELPKKKKEKKLEKEKKPKVSAPFHVTPISHAEPIIGHHQNIGGHHIPATSIPQSSIYDRALAQTAPTATHSARDEGFVRGVTEKKLAEKEARRTGLVAPPTSSNVV